MAARRSARLRATPFQPQGINQMERNKRYNSNCDIEANDWYLTSHKWHRTHRGICPLNVLCTSARRQQRTTMTTLDQFSCCNHTTSSANSFSHQICCTVTKNQSQIQELYVVVWEIRPIMHEKTRLCNKLRAVFGSDDTDCDAIRSYCTLCCNCASGLCTFNVCC